MNYLLREITNYVDMGSKYLMGEHFVFPQDIKVAAFDSAVKGDLTFWESRCFIDKRKRPLTLLDQKDEELFRLGKDVRYLLCKTNASILIVSNHYFPDTYFEDKLLIFVDYPRLAFMNVCSNLFPSDLGTMVLGSKVRIGSNCSIGGDGFGAWRMRSGKIKRFPQFGKVVLGNDVQIGDNVCVDRGALSNTVIGAGTHIDNLVHIAHNVQIGLNCVVVARAMIGGSVKIGDRCWIGPSASILNGVTIGNDCVVGIGAVVLNDMEDCTVAVGNPASVRKRG